MSNRQRTVFTALPNGLGPGPPGRYRLSVHVAPQLRSDADTVLAAFPDWANWPVTVNTIAWSVSFGGGPPVPATVDSMPAQASLWSDLFASGALVRSHNPPVALANRKLRSYPARNVMAFVRKLYTDFALASPEDYPHIDDLHAVLGPVSVAALRATATPFGMAEVEAELSANRVVVNGAPLASLAKDFYQLHRFHQSRSNIKALDDADLPPVPRPKLDFHEAVSAAGEYPPLLRLLGLVVDLVVDLGSGLPPSPTDVRVVPSWSPAPPSGLGSTADFATPRTRCLLDGGQFRARPRAVDPELVDGRLPFHDGDRYTLLQVDHDGAALKAIDFAGNLDRLRVGRSSASPDLYALPSLRSGGLAVARINRAAGFHDRLVRGAAAANQLAAAVAGDVMLDAEDVTRGHRFDVRDTREAKWFSLGSRTGTYEFPSGTTVPYVDETWTGAAVTEDDTAEQDLYLQETLFRWGGWSLAVPRPGGCIATTQDQDPPVESGPVETDPDFPVTVVARPLSASLPRLRFGRTYEVRARAVDLAGNSDPLDPAGAERRATPPVDYLRFEPVQSPPLLPFGPRTEGESLETVVLRSNYNSVPARDEVVARHVVPPKSDQVSAEQHGLFDTAYPGSVVDPATYATISQYLLPEPPPGPVLQSEQGSFATSSERQPDPDDHRKAFFFPVDLVTLPYLPDPMAAGAAFRFSGHPHVEAGQVVRVPFAPEPAWPAHKPFRLVLDEGDAAPSYDEAAHQFTVPLRKADVVRVRLSAYLPREHVGKMGIWRWIEAAGGGHLLGAVVDGRHWMVTPFRALTLVHAVRQPLALAQPVKDGPAGFLFRVDERTDGETAVGFRGIITFSRKSTAHIDVIANWGEYTDRGPGRGFPTAPTAEPPIPPDPRQAIAFSYPSHRASGEGAAICDPAVDRQELGDTRHRMVSYTTVATTRFAEYFVQNHDLTVSYAGGQMLVLLPTGGEGVVPGSVKVKNKVAADATGKVLGAANYVEGAHFTVDSAAGTVTLLAAAPGSPAAGQALRVSFLVPPIVRPGPGEAVDPAVISIRSTAPPAAPKVVYVVPTFGWEAKAGPGAGQRESVRRGRGLRVYLERPWWTSGEGELLGVVLEHPTADNPPSPARERVVTRVGLDPLFKSTGALPPLNIFSFPSAKIAGIGPNGEGLDLPGVEGKVLVSGHEVGFDRNRDLWYCDISVNAPSYFPFVKLGLARFQPQSIPGAHLSPAVLTDFCQLAPDRFVTVAPVVAGPAFIAIPGGGGPRMVTVTGQSYDKVGGDVMPPLVRVTVERLDPAVGPDLGWSSVGNPVTLAAMPKSGDDSVWRGQVVVPPAPGGARQRLVIEEFERHRTGAAPVFGQRLVYSDIIDL